MIADDDFGAVVRQLFDDLTPGEALRAKVAARRHRQVRRRQLLGVGGAALVLVAMIGVSSVLDEDRRPVIADGRDSTAACEAAGRGMVPTWLPPGWSIEPVSGAERRWLGPNGAQVEVLGRVVPSDDEEFPGSVTTVVENGGSTMVSGGDQCIMSVSGEGLSGTELMRVARSLVRRTDAFAMWPDTDPVEELRRIQLDDDADRRSDPSTMATDFARDALAWQEVTSTVRERSAYYAVVTVTHTASGVDADVELRSRPGDGPWSVFRVSTFPADHPVEVSIERRETNGVGRGSLEVRIAPEGPVAASQIEVSFGPKGGGGGSGFGPDQRAVLGTNWGDGDSVDLDAPGSVLVRYFDDEGATIAAWGVAVPAGDYRAEFPTRPERGPWPQDLDGDGAVSDSGAERIPKFVPAIGVGGREGWIEYELIEAGVPGTEAPVFDDEGRQIDVFRVD